MRDITSKTDFDQFQRKTKAFSPAHVTMGKETEEILVGKKINPTAMRLLVLEFLQQQNAATSLTDIENGLTHSDRITIYRTLKTFQEKGLVHCIEDGTAAPKYALCAENCDDHHHHDLHVHFYCNQCNKTYCLPDSKIPEIQLPRKFQTQELNLIVKGICDQCFI